MPSNDTRALNATERSFLAELTSIGFGRMERILVRDGALVLDPWPVTIRHLKLGAREEQSRPSPDQDFRLKRQVIEFFDQVRLLRSAVILRLEVRHGLPYAMEVETNAGEEGHTNG